MSMETVRNARPVAALIRFAKAHRFVSALIILAIVFGGYRIYAAATSTAGITEYVAAQVTKGTLVVSVTGTGQVSASDQVDVKPKTSGDVVYVGVTNGQEVRAGALLAELDPTDAVNAVKDAEISLDQAKLDLEKMKGLSTSEGTIRGTKEKAADDLATAYEDGYNTVSNAFLDLPNVMTGMQDMVYGTTLSTSQWNIDYYVSEVDTTTGMYNSQAHQFRNDALAAYESARAAYDTNLTDYKASSRFSDTPTIEKLIDETYATTKLIAEAVKNMNNLVLFYKDKLTEYNVRTAAGADTHLSALSSYTSKTNSYLTSLLSTRDTIQQDKETLINADFDVADQENVVAKAERTLEDAKETLAEHYIRAPFAGIVASVDVKRGDSVSAGTAIATLITKRHIAKLSLNEVDAAKVKAGEKATLTFDAVPDLSVAGEVSDVDTLGTVSQGVVSYEVTIGFDTEDARVKPGMTVSAAIVTDVKTDALLVPSGAVKFQNGVYSAEILSGTPPEGTFVPSTPPTVRTVEVGASNDTETEILSGLTEGEYVVARTVTNGATTAAKTSAPSIFGGGGGVRVLR